MSGICGLWLEPNSHKDSSTLGRLGSAMVAVMKHRGDKACVATVVDASLVLAARGSSGTPGSRMGFSADARYLVAFAGRANGLAPLYRTPEACESDTSAARIAQPIQSLGLRRTPELIDGSFCLAILHRRSHTLSLVRDRIGQCSPVLWLDTSGCCVCF